MTTRLAKHLAIVLLSACAAGHAAPAATKPASAPAAAPAPASTTRPSLTVNVVSLERAELSRRISANGNIVAWQEAVIAAESAIGRLERVGVQVGDRVRRGDVLAVANTELAEADLAQLQAAVAEAKAALAEAAANAARARAVADSGALSPQQLSQYQTAETAAQARVAAQTAALKAQSLRVRNATVRAPDDGIISARNATVGSVVPAGVELFRLIRQGRLEWRAEVAASELSRLTPGQIASISLPDGSVLKGSLRMLAPTIDPATRNGIAFVDLPAPGTARPGLFARGDFSIGSQPGWTLPASAVLLRDGFDCVLVVGAQGRVSQVRVQVGRRSDERVEITGGLPPQARVVANGGGFLADGDTVRVVASPAAKAAP
jgi:RND family efflux transporter MFP subunit